MTAAIRAEILKLTTIRLPLGLLGTGTALTAAMALLTAARAGSGASMAAAPLDTAAGLTGVLSTTYFAMIMAMVLGVTIATSESRHSTATLTYLATPHRARVLAAKTITAFGFGLIFGLAGAAITTAMGLGFTAAKGYHVSLAATTIARYGAGAILGSGLLASLGAGLGSLIRSQLAAVITVFLWAFLPKTPSEGSSTPRPLPAVHGRDLPGRITTPRRQTAPLCRGHPAHRRHHSHHRSGGRTHHRTGRHLMRHTTCPAPNAATRQRQQCGPDPSTDSRSSACRILTLREGLCLGHLPHGRVPLAPTPAPTSFTGLNFSAYSPWRDLLQRAANGDD